MSPETLAALEAEEDRFFQRCNTAWMEGKTIAVVHFNMTYAVDGFPPSFEVTFTDGETWRVQAEGHYLLSEPGEQSEYSRAYLTETMSQALTDRLAPLHTHRLDVAEQERVMAQQRVLEELAMAHPTLRIQHRGPDGLLKDGPCP